MGSLSALKSMSRAAHSAVEAGLPKPAPESKPATAAPKETAPDKTKPAVTKTAAPAKKSAGSAVGRSSYAPESVITVKSTEHGKKGNGAEALDTMKSGMTIEKFRAALDKKGRKGMCGWALRFAIENKLITISAAK